MGFGTCLQTKSDQVYQLVGKPSGKTELAVACDNQNKSINIFSDLTKPKETLLSFYAKSYLVNKNIDYLFRSDLIFDVSLVTTD